MHATRYAGAQLALVLLATLSSCAAPHATSDASQQSETPPRLLSLPPPYPANLPPGAANTYVSLHCHITEHGSADRCELLTAQSNPLVVAAVAQWLVDPATHFQPATSGLHAVPSSHRITITFAHSRKGSPEFQSTVSEEPNPFPGYPEDYAEQSLNGSVVFHFLAGKDGLPTQAGLDSVDGGDMFGRSVLRWLASGCVHYRPDFVQGEPVPTPYTHQAVHFQGWRQTGK